MAGIKEEKYIRDRGENLEERKNPTNLKKMIIFSCESNRKVVENMIVDESKVKNCRPSLLIEKYLLNSLLPENEDAELWIKNLYQETWTISEVFQCWMIYLSVYVKQRDSQPYFFDFINDLFHYHGYLDIPQDKYNYFLSIFYLLFIRLGECAKTAEGFEKEELLKEQAYGKELFRLLQDKPTKELYKKIFCFINSNWYYFKDFSRVYILLGLFEFNVLPETYFILRHDISKLVKAAFDE